MTGWGIASRPWKAPVATWRAISGRRGFASTGGRRPSGNAGEEGDQRRRCLQRCVGRRAPLGWDPKDMAPTAKAVVALLSDFFPKTSGEMIHVDGGLHSTGA